jgi:hypothetical protein
MGCIIGCLVTVVAGGVCCYRVVRWELGRQARRVAVSRAVADPGAVLVDRLCRDTRASLSELVAAAEQQAEFEWLMADYRERG